MRKLSLQMRGSVARNYIFSLIWRFMVQNGIFWTIGEQSFFFNYPIIYYLRIKVYTVEMMGMRISHWKNGVSGTTLVSIITMVLIL